jgi:hypothetical protein
MAQRRMFSKQVTNSSEFLMMSQSAQNLYFHFGMNADDDGFCEVFTIMRMTESKPDDLQALHARGLVYVVDNKICVVKDWHENNQIRLDRYKQSVYLSDPKYVELYKSIMEEKIKNIAVYKGLLGKPNGNQRLTQVRLGEVRIGKDRKENTSLSYLSNIPEADLKEFTERFDANARQIKSKAEDLLNYCKSKGKVYKDYQAFLLNALKKDFKIRQKEIVVKVDEPSMTAEQVEKARKAKEDITNMLVNKMRICEK